MNTKHPPKQSLLSYSNRFLIGLIVAMSLVFMAFEYTSEKRLMEFENKGIEIDDDLILPPVTFHKKQEELPKPKQVKSDELKIVKNIIKPVVDPDPTPDPTPEPDPEPFKFDPSLYGMTEPEPIDEYVPYTVIQIFPHTESCEGLSGEELKECSLQDIVNRIKSEFNTPEILREIGGRQAVLMTFVINKNGEVDDVKVKQESHWSMGKEAKKAIEKLPTMTPPSHQGRAVNMTLEVPILVNFRD